MVPNRELGAFPISIGTSLAIEGLLGTHPNNPKQPSGFARIGELWINIHTLVRNYYQSMSSKDTEHINPVDAAIVVMNEMRAIPEIIRIRLPNLKVEFYFQPIEDIHNTFPSAVYIKQRTDKQVRQKIILDLITRSLLDECKMENVPFTIIRKHPPHSRNVAAFLTHFTSDLLWKTYYERIFLLESHTGKLKTYVEWYTKLKGSKPELPLPFNEYTLQIFGDGQLFDGQDRHITKEVRALAEVCKWNGSTNPSKVFSDIMGKASGEIRRLSSKLLP